VAVDITEIINYHIISNLSIKILPEMGGFFIKNNYKRHTQKVQILRFR
jgi:hypothetical protein